MNWLKGFILSLAATSIAACSQQRLQAADSSVALQRLYAAAQCARQDITPSLTRIDSAKALGDVLNSASFVGAEQASMPTIDFDASVLVLLQLGQRANAGYGLEVTAEVAELRSKQLLLPVRELLPAADRMYASVLVSPCVVLQFPAAGVETISALGLQLKL